MTEQIIVDGVDVSGCPHYNYILKDGSCYSQDYECVKCAHNECFYKDYKTKEKECERLKKYLAEIKEITEHWRNEWINDPDERLGFEKILQKISEVE